LSQGISAKNAAEREKEMKEREAEIKASDNISDMISEADKSVVPVFDNSATRSFWSSVDPEAYYYWATGQDQYNYDRLYNIWGEIEQRQTIQTG
jgi:hypothetical protein